MKRTIGVIAILLISLLTLGSSYEPTAQALHKSTATEKLIECGADYRIAIWTAYSLADQIGDHDHRYSMAIDRLCTITRYYGLSRNSYLEQVNPSQQAIELESSWGSWGL